MTPPPLVFLDANVLFSAALGGETFDLLFELAQRDLIHLVTSQVRHLEARRNIDRKRPDRTAALDDILRSAPAADVDPSLHLTWASALVGDADAHVLAAARSLSVAVLVTGDVTHFGPLMERKDLPFTIRTPRAFLLEGRPPPTV